MTESDHIPFHADPALQPTVVARDRAAFRRGFIDRPQLLLLAASFPNEYGAYLKHVAH